MDTTTDLKNQFHNKSDKMLDKANYTADKVKKAGENFLETPIGERFSDGLSDIRSRSVAAYDTSVEAFRKNPMIWLGAALGIGVIAGFALRRRS